MDLFEQLQTARDALEPSTRKGNKHNPIKDDFKSRLNSYVAVRVREEREGRKLTQADVADAAKISRTALVNFERGTQSLQIHKLYLVAYMLRVDIGDLFPTSLEDLIEST